MLHSYEFHAKVIESCVRNAVLAHCKVFAGQWLEDRVFSVPANSVKSSSRHTRYIQSLIQCVPGFVCRHTASKSTLGYYQSQNRLIARLSHE
jgi:hypothetical protein